MEMLRSFLCPECGELCKIHDGDYLFSYNLECSQGHKQYNLDQEFLLSIILRIIKSSTPAHVNQYMSRYEDNEAKSKNNENQDR